MEKDIKCNNCGKVITPNRKNLKKYCSELCQTRSSAKRRYALLKDDEEFKLKRKVKNKKYYEENKEEMKSKMRIYGKKYYEENKEEIKSRVMIKKKLRGEI